jgi:tRNA(Ile)-lysidine synthase
VVEKADFPTYDAHMAHKRTLEAAAFSTVEHYRMLEGGECVVVAVSGGPDSVALLLFLNGLASEMDLDLHVFHLDHMLRGEESAADARYVEELARDLGLPAEVAAVDVRRETAGAGRSPEDAAREVRLEKLREFALKIVAQRIATGHTADDQVETFLMRVIQGAGLTGLGGIPPVAGPFIRPLIEVWRRDVEEYCARMSANPRHDSSNMDTSFLRNRIRLDLLPFLVSEFGPSVKEVMLREVESLALDREFMGEQSAQAFDLVAVVTGEEVRLAISRLLSLPAALQRGAVREAWTRAAPGAQNLSWRHVMDVMDKVVAGRTGARLDLPGLLIVERSYDDVIFKPPDEEAECQPAVLPVPGTVTLPWADATIEARRVERDVVRLGNESNIEYLTPQLELPLEVRAPRAGDRFRPLGSTGTRKLADFFIDRKLPRQQRKRCPLVLSGGEIAWVAGIRLDERFRLRSEESEAVMLIMRPAGEYDLPAEEDSSLERGDDGSGDEVG